VYLDFIQVVIILFMVFYLIIIYKTNFVVKILGLNFRVVSAILTTGIGLATLRTEMAY
jgi:hypothetical protein